MDLTRQESAPPLPALLRAAIVPFTLGLFLAAGCYWAAGPTLGLWLGGLVIAAMLVPALTLAEQGWRNRIIAGGSVVDGVAVVWLVAVVTSETGLFDWIRAYVLLAAWAAAVWGVAVVLEHLLWTLKVGRWKACPEPAEGLNVSRGERSNVEPSTSNVQRPKTNAPAAAALAVVMALAWLTWPVWLSPILSQGLSGPGAAAVVDLLVPVHPPMAINAVLLHLGIWGQQPVAYQLTTLGQDIPYALPRGIGWSVLLHIIIAAAAAAVARSVESRFSSS